MAKLKRALLVGLSVVGAYGVAKAVAFLVVSPAVTFFNTPKEEKEFRAGFEEVSSDLSGWQRTWQDSSGSVFRTWGPRITALYLSGPDVITLFRWRGESFQRVASDPKANKICQGADITETIGSQLDMLTVSRILGRGFGRHHAGVEPWVPQVDLATDEDIWVDFRQYLVENGLEDVWEGMLQMLEGTQPAPEQYCMFNARLFLAVADSPDDLVGEVRLVDFVRALEVLTISS